MDSNKELTERDWQIILSGVQKIIFNKNDVILLQDTVNEYLWRIYQGKVRVEKRDNDQMKLLSILGILYIFKNNFKIVRSWKYVW